MTDRAKPVVGITIGDPVGIGPEITIKALAEKAVYEVCKPLVVADVKVIERFIDSGPVRSAVNLVQNVSEANFEFGVIDVLEVETPGAEALPLGKVSRQAGWAAVEYTKKAVELALAKQIAALAQAPVNKEAMYLAGYKFDGQSGLLKELTNSKDYAMMLMFGPVKMFLVTTHVSLRNMCDLITKQRVLRVIRMANQALKEFGVAKPKIGVAGLNPHAGDRGLFGDEETKQITPAIEQAQLEQIEAIGPIPADTIFVKAKDGQFDVVVAMYHDQGAIAMKLLGFGGVTTVLFGLPIIRTSVGHGTAFDIAGQGIAQHRNMVEAIKVAADTASKRSSG